MKKSVLVLLLSTVLLVGCGKKDDVTVNSTDAQQSEDNVETSVIREPTSAEIENAE